MPSGRCGAMSRTTAPLPEPTSETVAPRIRCGPISAATSPQAPTGTHTITRSAPATAAALSSATRSASPSSATRRRVAAERAVATISRTVPCARAAWAIDEPIRPTPIKARRLYNGAGRLTLNSLYGWLRAPLTFPSFAQKFLQRGAHEPVRFFGADTHSQRIRELVAADLTQNESARGEERVGVLGGASPCLREMDEQEIGDARGHLEPELFEFLRQPSEPAIVVLTRALLVCVIFDRCDAGSDRGRTDVERTAYAVNGGNDVGRTKHPTQTQGGEAVNFGEGTGHDHIVARGDELNAGFVVVAPYIFGIGRIQHEHHLRRQAAMQPLDLIEGDVGAGRIVRIGEKDDLCLLRHR